MQIGKSDGWSIGVTFGGSSSFRVESDESSVGSKWPCFRAVRPGQGWPQVTRRAWP